MKPCFGLPLLLASSTATLLVFGAAAAAQQPRITVGPNVQVSAARPHEAHEEVLVDADPANPNLLLGCSMVIPDPLTRRWSDSVAYVSSDGGGHWKPTLYVGSDMKSAGDPACAFGPDGKAYSVFLQSARKPPRDEFPVYRSNDQGETWKPPAHIAKIDRDFITVDTTGGKYNGRIYINGTGSVAAMDFSMSDRHYQTAISIQRSLDGGRTFQAPFERVAPLPNWVVGMGNGVVLPDGTYLAVFGEQRDVARTVDKPPYSSPNSWLKFIESTDGGDTYSKAATISDWYMDYGDILTTSSIIPVVAVDRSHGPFRSRLYVVWPDYRSGRGQILLCYSSNEGKTWSKPIVVDDDRAWPPPARGPDDVMPVVAVNREGVVGVIWYDRRDNPHNFGWSVRFAASNDGGETFSPSVQVSTAPATINLRGQIGLVGWSVGGGKPYSFERGGDLQVNIGVAPLFFAFNGGHTAGMAADAAGRFHPFWIDNRTGVPQVWTAAVSVAGVATINGSRDLERLSDVTDDVTLDFTNCQFNRAKGTVSVDAYLGNTSDATLSAPILVRMLSLTSQMGSAGVVGAENGESGPGAIWDFSGEVPRRGAGLAPGEILGPKRLTFLLHGVRWTPDPPSALDLENFVNFQAKVLAPKPLEKKTAR